MNGDSEEQVAIVAADGGPTMLERLRTLEEYIQEERAGRLRQRLEVQALEIEGLVGRGDLTMKEADVTPSAAVTPVTISSSSGPLDKPPAGRVRGGFSRHPF